MIPVSNPLAASLNTRNGERNLNRNFYPKSNPQDFEDHLNNVLCPILSNHEVILDLHSFKVGKHPFALIKSVDKDHSIELNFTGEIKTVYEKTLAGWLGVSTVVGNWTETYERGVSRRVKEKSNDGNFNKISNLDPKYGVGTTEFSREKGAIAVTLECGQHRDPMSEKFAFNAILGVLTGLGMIKSKTSKSKNDDVRYVSLFEVYDKQNISDFLLDQWKNFDFLKKDAEIASRKNGVRILAPEDCYILFPNKNATPGNEWFYLARKFTK